MIRITISILVVVLCLLTLGLTSQDDNVTVVYPSKGKCCVIHLVKMNDSITSLRYIDFINDGDWGSDVIEEYFTSYIPTAVQNTIDWCDNGRHWTK